MLKKIRLNNFRCFEFHELEFKDLSIIVGKNNAGKSTLIESLRLISMGLTRFKTGVYHDPPIWLDLPKLVKGISPKNVLFEFNVDNITYSYSPSPSIITAFFELNIVVTLYINDNAELFYTFQKNDEYINKKSNSKNVQLPTLNILPPASLAGVLTRQ